MCIRDRSEAVSIYEEEYAITVPAYGHERRGAPVNTSIMIDSKPVLLNCFVYEPEIVLVSDASFLTREIDIGAGISENAVLVLNTGDEGIAGQFKMCIRDRSMRWALKGIRST